MYKERGISNLVLAVILMTLIDKAHKYVSK